MNIDNILAAHGVLGVRRLGKPVKPPTNLAISSLKPQESGTISWDEVPDAESGYRYSVFVNGLKVIEQDTLSIINTISGNYFNPSDEVYFEVKVRRTSTTIGSDYETSQVVTVEKAEQLLLPPDTWTTNINGNSITVDGEEGLEARLVGEDEYHDLPFTFTGLLPNTRYYFEVRYKETETHKEGLPATYNHLTGMSEQEAPSKPVVSAITSNSATVTLAPDEFTLFGEQVQIRGVGAMYDWFDVPHTFTGLSPLTDYIVHARRKSSFTHYVSPESTTAFKTDKITPSAPAQPTVSEIGENQATVTGGANTEVSLTGNTWYDSPYIFTGLSVGTQYTAYSRIKESDSNHASPSSNVTFSTLKLPQELPKYDMVLEKYVFGYDDKLNGDGFRVVYNKESKAVEFRVVELENAEWITVPPAFGTYWLTGLQVVTTYTIEYRYKETTTHEAGPSKTVTGTTDRILPPKPIAVVSYITDNGATITGGDEARYTAGGSTYSYKPAPLRLTNLQPNTTYKAAVRLKETATHKSYASVDISFTTLSTPAPTSVPGPSLLSGGNSEAGFYGITPWADLILPADLSVLVGYPASNQSFGGWLKFSYQGKILFFANRPIRTNINWSDLNNLGLVFGEKVITIGDHQYKVRLIRGSTVDPSNTSGVDLHQSEWNRLMIPLYYKIYSDTHTWNKDNIDPNHENWGRMYNDSDLAVVSSSMGSRVFCQERIAQDPNLVLFRGDGDPAKAGSASASTAVFEAGWRPVLELI